MVEGKHHHTDLEYLMAMWAFQQDRGYPPSIRDIARALQVSSTSNVRYRLISLARKGFVVNDASGTSRSYHVTRDPIIGFRPLPPRTEWPFFGDGIVAVKRASTYTGYLLDPWYVDRTCDLV